MNPPVQLPVLICSQNSQTSGVYEGMPGCVSCGRFHSACEWHRPFVHFRETTCRPQAMIGAGDRGWTNPAVARTRWE